MYDEDGAESGLSKAEGVRWSREEGLGRSALKPLRRHRQQEIREQLHTRPNWGEQGVG